jgi:hypothetical protein
VPQQSPVGLGLSLDEQKGGGYTLIRHSHIGRICVVSTQPVTSWTSVLYRYTMVSTKCHPHSVTSFAFFLNPQAILLMETGFILFF